MLMVGVLALAALSLGAVAVLHPTPAAAVTALCILAVGGSLALWHVLQLHLRRPLLGLRDALHRLRRGDPSLRLPETGTFELQQIAEAFNDLARTQARRDQGQLEFLAGVAHDLRNPLHTLKLTTTTLIAQSQGQDELAIQRTQRRISRQVDRLSRMVEDLLDRTRIEAGNLELRLEICDLRGLVSELVDLHRLGAWPLLELAAPTHDVLVECDPARVEQVLTNLLSNAFKYSPPGSPIRVAVETDSEWALVSVTDLGIGIPEEQRERLFEPFQRANPLATDVPGVGLGLCVARRIMRAHRGDLELSSAVGKGSTFCLRLPRSAGASAASTELPSLHPIG
jgi:signal transduction histidine kinase